MSDFLLQKSLKLLQDSKQIKKGKQSKIQKLKKKKKYFIVKKLGEEEYQQNILENLDKLEKLSHESAVDVSEKVLSKVQNLDNNIIEETKDEPTVFTDKDFEEFEKEYFES